MRPLLALLLAFATLLAGCSDGSGSADGDDSLGEEDGGTDEAQMDVDGGFEPRPTVLLSESYELMGGESVEFPFTLDGPVRNATIVIGPYEGVVMDLVLSGPGSCAGTGVAEGVHVVKGGAGLHLNGRETQGEVPCGSLPAGEHSVTVSLGQGQAAGSFELVAVQ